MIAEKAGEVLLLINLKINWKEIISQYKLDPTLNWQFAEIISIDDSKIQFVTIEKKIRLREIYL